MRETENKHILFVDDNVAFLVVCESFFADLGYHVEIAASAREALQLLDSKPFWTIFTDLAMPEMDGLQLCREIRRRGFKGRVIAITGYPDKFEFSDCQKAGFDGYFSKPVEMEMLQDVLESRGPGGVSAVVE